MSQAYYGSYAHATNSVGFNSYSREYVDGPTGFHKLLRTTIEIEAKIILSTQLLIFAELEVMRAAYSIGGQSFAFYDDNGVPLSWGLDSNSCVGGITVLKPVSHQEVKGSHGVNFLKCHITLQGDQLVPGGQYLSFSEVVTFSGRGGPLKVRRTPATGKPFKQTVSEFSWYTASQSGTLSTVTANPQPMAPIWPEFYDGNEGDHQITRPGGVTTRGLPTEYSVSWAYQFSSADPLTGQANTY